MGLTQTKLHYKILKESWNSTHAHLGTPQGQRAARQPNPLGDLPLHLACYGGQAPPSVIRALILAYPAAADTRNKEGFTPVELARVNYRRDGPHRAQVLELLEGSFVTMARRVAESNGTGSAIVLSEGFGASEHHRRRRQEGRSGSEASDGGSPSRRMMEAVHSPAVPPEQTYRSELCVICLDAKADHAVVPCGHVCLCKSCSALVRRNGYCPVGRCIVGNIVIVEDESTETAGTKIDQHQGGIQIERISNANDLSFSSCEEGRDDDEPPTLIDGDDAMDVEARGNDPLETAADPIT